MNKIPYIKVADLTKVYDISDKKEDGSSYKKSHTIFENINFRAYSKETTLLTGKSGCGKSTLLNYLATIDNEFKSGELLVGEKKISVDNNPIKDFFGEYKRASFRRYNVGFIFQSHMLLPDFTILENCLTPFISRGYINTKSEKLSKVAFKETAIVEIKKWFDIVELDYSNLYKYPNELSGGQQQRVAIVRGVVHKPKLLISDEPTASLDDMMALKIIKSIHRFVEEHHICHVIVTHQTSLYETVKNAHYHFEKELDAPATLLEVFRK
ncbi:MAG: ATP-binding cassette domain-containing protein [Sulfurimonas sp.]|nr:ATP-binding cassette domain-containing protein [Sulfurimonas sp.]